MGKKWDVKSNQRTEYSLTLLSQGT